MYNFMGVSHSNQCNVHTIDLDVLRPALIFISILMHDSAKQLRTCMEEIKFFLHTAA